MSTEVTRLHNFHPELKPSNKQKEPDLHVANFKNRIQTKVYKTLNNLLRPS